MPGRRPPALPLGVEARHAELATIPGDMHTMLAMLSKLDPPALIDARSLQVTQVHVTADGTIRSCPTEEPDR